MGYFLEYDGLPVEDVLPPVGHRQDCDCRFCAVLRRRDDAAVR